mgnify:CR=1 FL=1
MDSFTHLDGDGSARMVDVGSKPVTARLAVAGGRVRMRPATLAALRSGRVAKGDVLTVARIAGIQAAKRCDELIPLCHGLPLDSVELQFRFDEARGALHIEGRCAVTARTGVEMEAMTAVSVAALTIYDMCKAVDRGMVIDAVRLLRKEGGRSGTWVRDGAAAGESPAP